MDNNAFKDLVRSKVKSTKEIAREAVEEAFNRKKKRKRGRGGGGGRRGGDNHHDDLSSSSESESESHHNNNNKKQAKRDNQLLQPTAVTSKKRGGKDNTKYRDRAKERREGKNEDYQDSQQLLDTVTQGGEDTSLDQAEISKYLGGDEAHTHLVKGLDVALARSEKSKEQGTTTGDEATSEDLYKDIKPFESSEKAWEFIHQQLNSNSSFNTATPRTISALGTSMLEHLSRRERKQKHISVSAAGSSIQRSQLSFSVDWHPQNQALSWEIPSERNHAAASMQTTILTKASPLPLDLIQQIQSVQNKRQMGPILVGFAGQTQSQTSNDHSSNAGTDKFASKGTNSRMALAEVSNVEAVDSDDDIFPDAGD